MITLLGVHSDEVQSVFLRYMCTLMFIEALFTIAKT